MTPPALPLPSGELFERAACGLLLTDTDGTIRRVNGTFCRWIGVVAAELVDRQRVQDLLTMGGRVFHQTHWAPLMQIQGSVSEVKLDVLHRDGHKVPMLFNALRQKYGEAVYDDIAVVVVTDRQKYERELLAARKTAEAAREQLTQANERKDQFLATLAHELRNPLAPIRNVVEILKRQDFSDPALVWSRDVLDRQSRQLTRLVDDLLEASRITQGKLTLQRERLDLADALSDAIDAAKPIIEASSHALKVTVPAQRVVLYADPTRVTQMVFNLLNNAAKYTPEGGTIWLTAERRGVDVVVSVRDSGIGIAPAHLAGVFEMFSQIAPALHRTDGGLGIGLALVKGLAELHGGQVGVASEGLDRGSEFVLTLPINLADDPVSDSPAVHDAPAGRLRILVVDDNEDAASSLTMLLELQGHEVHAAHEGLAALAAAQAFAPQLILLDIGLPTIDGHEVARRIRLQGQEPRPLLVAVTGWGQQQDKAATAAAGFDHHLTKPVEIEDLNRLLASVRR